MVDVRAEELGVSPHTIRRDINALCEQAKLRRIHGGAEYFDATVNMPYGARAVLNAGAKRAIAQEVAKQIPDGATVFLSIGTTPAIVAASLARKDRLTVVTNNLNAAMALAETVSHRLIVPGGDLRLPDCDILNPAAIDLFSSYRADYGFYGVGGIDHDGRLLDFHGEEARLRETIRANSRASILVADRTKFGRRPAAVGGHLNDVDTLVIDAMPDAAFAPLLADLPGLLIVAEHEEAA